MAFRYAVCFLGFVLTPHTLLNSHPPTTAGGLLSCASYISPATGNSVRA
jgi:hypothetical protein